jgi:hypothetical protein
MMSPPLAIVSLMTPKAAFAIASSAIIWTFT